jgi:hypothetical protein
MPLFFLISAISGLANRLALPNKEIISRGFYLLLDQLLRSKMSTLTKLILVGDGNVGKVRSIAEGLPLLISEGIDVFASISCVWLVRTLDCSYSIPR